MRKLTIFLAVSIILALLLSACAQPAPSPTAKPSPTDVPTPAASPKPTATPATTPAQAPTQIEIWAGKFGGSGYIAGNAYAEEFKKNSTWLRATSVETLGSTDKVRRMGEATLETKKKTIFSAGDLNYWLGMKGMAPFTKKIELKAVSLMGIQLGFVISNNPKIRTPQDLIGKKVNVGAKGSGIDEYTKFLLNDSWGIWDKIEKSTLDWEPGKAAFMDGQIDAMITMANLDATDTYSPHPTLVEPLAGKRDIFFIGPTPEDVAGGNKKAGWSFAYYEIPAGKLGAKQPQKLGTFTLTLAYFVAPEFPNEVAYEWLRIADKYHKEMPKYGTFLRLLTPDNLGWLPVASESEIHPGALKYFKDNKLPIKMAK